MLRTLLICLALSALGCPAETPSERSEGKTPVPELRRGSEEATPKPSEPKTGGRVSVTEAKIRNQLQDLRARGKLVKLRVGTVPIQAYVADTTESRRVGLMHVPSLTEAEGMIFVYPEAVRGIGFWMKNTLIPLSLAYVRDDGTIDQILDMQPHSRKTHPSTGLVRFVLEVNQGWFKRHGVKVGDRIEGVTELEGS